MPQKQTAKPRLKTKARPKAKSNAKGKIRLSVKNRLNPLLYLPVIIGVVGVGLAMTFGIFAAPGPAPASMNIYAGGNSLAVLWKPAAGDSPAAYKLYRNGAFIADVPPSTNLDNGPGSVTQRYIDRNVVNGSSYTYQVSAVNAAGEESALTAGLTATQPLTPVPVPAITIAPGTPSDLVDYMNSSKTFLEDWYPKIVVRVGNLAGTPTSFTIRTANQPGSGPSTAGTTITIPEDYARTARNLYHGKAVWIHESTHVALAYPSAPSFIGEGIPDYIKAYWYGSHVPSVPTTNTWQDKYDPQAYFLNWVSTNFTKTNIIRQLHISAKAGYDPAFFEMQTGLSIGELWREMVSTKLHSPMYLKNSSGKCLDVPSNSLDDGAIYQLYTCNKTDAQSFIFIPNTYTSNEGTVRVNGRCMDVAFSGTTDGTRVWQYGCNGSIAQKWTILADGSLKNPNSGKCLNPIGGGTTDGTGMEIRTCSTSGAQKWGVRPISIMKNRGTPYCLDSTSGDVLYSNFRNYTCDYSTDQLMEFVQTSRGSADGTYRMYGRSKCLHVNGSGTADGTRVFLYTCNGGVAQKWTRQSDGTLRNPNSGKCLQPAGSSTSLGATMEIHTCTTASIQKWDFATF